jgi:phosphatidylserine/phosphatidylglycerophosphate/cardiolipin synthase-like enzyme
MKRLSAFLVLTGFITLIVLINRTDLPGRISASDPTANIVAVKPMQAIVVLPDDGPAAILDEINAARISIDLYVYLLPSEEVLASLTLAHQRDVAVRVILERDPFGGGNSNQETYDQLSALGIEVRWAPDQFQFSHIKMVIVDGHTALIMTLNLSYSALNLNREFAVITTDPADVAGAQSIFSADWANHTATFTDPLVVSPVNSRATFLRLIRAATTSIDIYAEVVRDREIVEALIAATERGISVRIIVPADPAPDDITIYQNLAANGIQIRLLADLYSHAKAIIIDQVRAFTGSQNLTQTSLDDNRELGIVLNDQANLARLSFTFEGDWRASPAMSSAADRLIAVGTGPSPACEM